MNSASTGGSRSGSSVNFKPGERVRHADFGEGVVIASPIEGFIKVFFPSGERQVPVAGLTSALEPFRNSSFSMRSVTTSERCGHGFVTRLTRCR